MNHLRYTLSENDLYFISYIKLDLLKIYQSFMN